MTNAQRELKEHFLEPETRCGYFVSAEKKAVWKVQLDMLEELLNVCRRHGLKISLAAGSLLGAIRHSGFIPWDDDFDVMLPRKDFDKLVDIGPREFRHPLFFQTPKTDPGYVHAMAKLRNSCTTAIVPDYARNGRMCNMGIFIDIYPLDDVPKSTCVISFKIKLMRLFHKLRSVAFSHRRGRCTFRFRIAHFIARAIYAIAGSGRMYDIQNWIFLLGQSWVGSRGLGMAPAVMSSSMLRFTYPKELLDDCVVVPFEYIDVPVFSGYEKMLEITYGNWRKLVEGAAGHQELIVDARRPYTDVLAKEFGYSNIEIDALSCNDCKQNR